MFPKLKVYNKILLITSSNKKSFKIILYGNKVISTAQCRFSSVPVKKCYAGQTSHTLLKMKDQISEKQCSTQPQKVSSVTVEVATSQQSKDDKKGSESNDPKGTRRYLGIFFALAAALAYSLSALTIKIIKYHPYNFGVWRFISMIVITFPFLVYGHFFQKEKDQPKSCENAGGGEGKRNGIFKDIWPPNKTTTLLILQGILGSNSIMFVFFGLAYLDIGDSIVISTSAPVFVAIAAWLVLKEQLGIIPLITTVITMVGVTIICKPPVLTGAAELNADTLKGVAYNLASMVLLTACYVLIRYLRKVNHALIQLSFAVWGLLQSLAFSIFLGVLEVPANWNDAGLIVLNAFLAFTAQTTLTLALKYEQAGIVSLLRTTEVVFCYLWQAFFLHVQPDLFSVIGAVITMACVVVIGLRNTVQSLPDDDKRKKIFGFLLL